MADAADMYDELPYSDQAFAEVHPDRLAVVGALYGLTPAPVERCSVLELGCGVGGNLIPMAAALPNARLLGIDLSARQIEQGRAVVGELGLGNLELRAQDLMDFPVEEGPFDYILCHGVYAWVPPPVQERILDICRRNLTAGGLAMISYNALPGRHQDMAVRDILRFGARGAGGPVQQVQEALAFLTFVARSAFDRDTPYARCVRAAAEVLGQEHPTHVYHEYLASCNSPLSFEEFARRFAVAELRHVAEAGLVDPSNQLTEEARQALAAIEGDAIRCEQTLDFFGLRTFRKDVLCRQSQAVERWPQPAGLAHLRLLGLAEPVDETPQPARPGGGPSGPAVQRFRNAKGWVLSAREPALRTALLLLGRAYPRAVPYAELLDQVRAAADGQVDETSLGQALLACGLASFVELHAYLPPIAAKPGLRPKATVSAQRQAAEGKLVVDLRHRSHRLDAMALAVLSMLDGAHVRGQLCEAIRRRIAEHELTLPQRPADVSKVVDGVLDSLAGLCLLME
jgi:SAM-dependent methyltransferase